MTHVEKSMLEQRCRRFFLVLTVKNFVIPHSRLAKVEGLC